jgi:hypothetical protein
MNNALLYLQMQKSNAVEVESKLLAIMDKLHYIYI